MNDTRGESGALSLGDCLSSVSSDSTRVVVPLLELPATSVPRAIIAFAWFSGLASNNADVCVDDEYAAAYSGH